MPEECYRQCASAMVFRTVGDHTEVLLLHKPRKCDAWQLPQGGIEAGESLSEAAMRELKEEANITATVIGEADAYYQYDFPESFRCERPDHVCGQRVSFVYARLDDDTPVQVDDHEVDGHVWVQPEQLRKYIMRREYLALVEQLCQRGIALLASE